VKLYVDDIRACPEGWNLARTATAAIRILAQFEVTEVSLDHDICHQVPMRPDVVAPVVCEETFEAVAWFIAAMPKEIRPQVKFHTANPDGAQKMASVLSSFRWPDMAARKAL
jgi:hypothetical protein